MEANFFKTLGQIAGIGGISLGVLLFILRGIIRKKIFPKFKNEKLAYRLLRLIVIVVWSVAIIGIAAWVITSIFNKKPGDTITISNTEFSGDTHFANSGFILNQYRQEHGEALDDKELKSEIERGMNLIKGGIYEEALPIFQKIAENEKMKLPAVYNNLGGLYALTKNYDKAGEAYTRAIERAPDYQLVQYNFGLLKEKQGKPDEAARHYNKAKALGHSRQLELKKLNKLTPRPEEKMETNRIESEPNNDILTPNSLPVGEWVQGEITGGTDIDFFKFTTPDKYRDIIKVELKNTNTTLQPYMRRYDEKKEYFGDKSASTNGQNIEFSFSTNPNLVYFILIGGQNGTYGPYQLKITPLKAYDGFEPNNDTFRASPLTPGKSIEANIMDAWDVDYYRIKTTSKETSVVIALENQSSTLQPYMQRYDEKKEYLGDKLASTNGQNIEFSFSTTPNLVYFILIGGQNRTSGAYRLTVSEKSGDGT
jgi:tetratricopeptide (TPR) repeat protein